MAPATAENVRGTRTAIGSVGDRAGRGRTLDERIFVRFPSLFRPLAGFLARLPPRSRLRRSLIARRAGGAYAAANRRDLDAILFGIDPGRWEYRPSPDLFPPDMDSVFRGPDGYRKMWQYWFDAFEDFRWEPREILDLGDKALITVEQGGHGSGSGVALSEPIFQLFTFERGLVVRQEDFSDRSAALEAAGMRE